MISEYEKAVKTITSKGRFRIELGLERIRKILELLENPQCKLKIIHVAGTNGKGSVCSVLAKIIEKSGYKTGLYTSPHLIKYTERIKINSNDISEENFVTYINEVTNLAEINNFDLTEFEILTAAAFKYFADFNVEYAVIETGMGGRFDATNVADNKLLSIITSISYDHKDRLGDTIEKIAFEKAGIIRTNTPAILSKDNLGFETVEKFANNIGAKIIIPQTDVQIEFANKTNYINYKNNKYSCPLWGLYQAKNFKLIFEAVNILKSKGINISEQAIQEALNSVQWLSRFQYIKEKNLLIDGAHNEDAAKVLRQSLDYYFPKLKRTWLFGAMNTKDYKTVASILFEENDEVFFYHFNDSRAISFEDFKKVCPFAKAELNENKIQNLLNNNEEDRLKIVTGSFYVTGKILNLI